MIGEIYYDPNYQFNDGAIGKKLFVIIGVSPNKMCFLAIKTTSKQKIKTSDYSTECLGNGQYFFIQERYDNFLKNTWLDYTADSFKEITASEYISKKLSKAIERIGQLSVNTKGAMKNCLKISEDLPQKYIEWL